MATRVENHANVYPFRHPGIAEDPADYDAGAEPTKARQPATTAAICQLQAETLRLTADAQIRRILRLTNMLDNSGRGEEGWDLCVGDIRDATSQLEECLYALADLASCCDE